MQLRSHFVTILFIYVTVHKNADEILFPYFSVMYSSAEYPGIDISKELNPMNRRHDNISSPRAIRVRTSSSPLLSSRPEAVVLTSEAVVLTSEPVVLTSEALPGSSRAPQPAPDPVRYIRHSRFL